MQLNHGKFRANGKCGYILKPSFMLQNESEFDPNDAQHVIQYNIQPVKLQICIIAGRHFCKRGGFKGFPSPYVEIEVYGATFDTSSAQKYVTKNVGKCL